MMNMNKRVGFSPDVNDKPPPPPISNQYYKHGGYAAGGTKVGGNKKRVVYSGIWSFRINPKSSSLSSGSGFSPVRFLKRVGAEVAKALRSISSSKKCSPKVSSSASLARSRSYAETLDSQRAEAIEDCIEFLNSSSSLQRSNSVASSC